MFLCRLNGVGGKIFIEPNAADVATNLARQDDGEVLGLEYFEIVDADPITLEAVTLTTGTRATAPARETVEIEAGGRNVGSVNRVAP